MASFNVNNTAYSWGMINLKSTALGGAPLSTDDSDLFLGVTGIKWNIKRNMGVNYGLHGMPANRGYGNVEYEASITMDYNTQVKLRQLSAKNSLRGLGEFDLQISWAGELDEEGNVVGTLDTETITLEKCVFDEDGMEAGQNDTSITKEFNLNPFKIKVVNSTARG